MCVCGSGHLVRVVAGRNTYITLEVAYQAQVVCYGDRIVAHVGIYSCMFSLSLCSAVTVFCDNFLSEKMYSVLLENIFTFISRLYMYSKLITLVRVLQIWSVITVYMCIESERELLNIHCNIRIGTLSILCMHSYSHEVFQYTTTNHLVTLYGIAQLPSQQTSNRVYAYTIFRPVLT